MSGGPIEAPKIQEAIADTKVKDAAASLMGQKPEQIESLLRFLIYLVLHKEKMSPEEYNK